MERVNVARGIAAVGAVAGEQAKALKYLLTGHFQSRQNAVVREENGKKKFLLQSVPAWAKVWNYGSKHKPHQGKRECARRDPKSSWRLFKGGRTMVAAVYVGDDMELRWQAADVRPGKDYYEVLAKFRGGHTWTPYAARDFFPARS